MDGIKLEPTLLNLPRASAHRKPNQLILPSCSWVGYPDGTAHHEHIVIAPAVI